MERAEFEAFFGNSGRKVFRNPQLPKKSLITRIVTLTQIVTPLLASRRCEYYDH